MYNLGGMGEPAGEVTRLLGELSRGRREVEADLIPLIYHELRRLAAAQMKRERSGHTLQPTALVHEAYLRLAGQHADWQNRAHFFAVAAQAMRRVLLDHARQHHAGKRGSQGQRITLEEGLAVTSDPLDEVLAVDECVTRLAAIDPRQARLVELRFFAGLSVEESAQALGISEITAKRDWASAKAWLSRELRRGGT
jgi:RNA polymerase sigma-70 factor (ECF subfamily)